MHFLVHTVLATGSKSFLITSFSYETHDDKHENDDYGDGNKEAIH